VETAISPQLLVNGFPVGGGCGNGGTIEEIVVEAGEGGGAFGQQYHEFWFAQRRGGGVVGDLFHWHGGWWCALEDG